MIIGFIAVIALWTIYLSWRLFPRTAAPPGGVGHWVDAAGKRVDGCSPQAVRHVGMSRALGLGYGAAAAGEKREWARERGAEALSGYDAYWEEVDRESGNLSTIEHPPLRGLAEMGQALYSIGMYEDDMPITAYPVALVKGQRILLDGKAVAEVDGTHLCHSRENLLAYIVTHPIRCGTCHQPGCDL